MAANDTISPKVSAPATVSTVVTALVALLSVAGVVVPEDVSTAAIVGVGAIVTVVNFVIGYFATDPQRV
jgi:hypothetical protein